jgi:predicted RNA-binding Zn-ribbon protein involved in translation (DUF1610 family)
MGAFMSQAGKPSNIIRCNKCQYIGPGKSNSTMLFGILLALFIASAYFLPAVIIALIYMAWIMSQPAKFSCPQCKTRDVTSVVPSATE